MKNLSILALLFLGLLLASCGGDGVGNCGTNFNIGVEIQDELQAFTNAAMVYGNDPTTENCNAYKSAAQDYVDALESFRSCAEDAGQLSEFNMSLDEARDSVDSIAC